MDRNDWFLSLGYGGALIALVAVALVTLLGNSATAAAWVQAFGSIAAIGAGFAVAIYQSSERRRRDSEVRTDRAKAFALLFAPTAARMAVALIRIERCIKKHEHGMDLVTAAVSSISPACEEMSFCVNIDHELLRGVEVLPAGVAKDIIFLTGFVEEFDEFIDEHLPLCRQFSGEQRAAYCDDVDRRIVSIKYRLTRARTKLDTIYGDPTD